MIERDRLASLQEDQRRRWKQGERVTAEGYATQVSGLAADAEALLDLILGEIILREEAGEQPALDEFLGRFPDLEAPLRLQFEVHQMIQDDECSALGDQSGTAIGWVESPWPLPLGGSMEGAPASLPGYEITGELGRGGMGVVYRARQLGLNREVALKMILAGAYAGPDERTRFRIEAEAVARLQHPNIVQVYEVGEWERHPFLSLELVHGGSLEQKLGGVPLAPREAARLAEILARALDHVHGHGILHRDLKPSNILLTSDGVPKITDFGLAKLVDSDLGQTPTEALIGTPSYMAPEQASGNSRLISVRSDVYALGAMLYEALTGRPPFRAETPMDTLRLVLVREPAPPSRLQPKVARDLETVCLKCLEKEPSQRYDTAGELADDLERFLAGEPIRARPVSLWRCGLKWARRRPTAAALAAVSIAAVLTLLGGGLAVRHAEQVRLREKRSAGERLISQAQTALAETGTTRASAEANWTNAKADLARALAEVGREPLLADVHARAVKWQAEVDRRLDQQDLRRSALARRQSFDQGRNEVLFRGTQPVDEDASENVRIAQNAARTALNAVGLSDRAAAARLVDHGFTADEAEEIRTGAYELLLVLADALARPSPSPPPQRISPVRGDRLDEALRNLDRAATLHAPSRSYHQRRARILALQGNAAAAKTEQALAESLAPAGALDAFLAGVDRFMGGAEPAERTHLETAIGDFRHALRLQPEHFWAHYYLAVACLNSHSDRAELAIDHLTECTGQRPDWVWAYLLRASASGRLEQLDLAEADFRKVEQLRPNAEARYALYINRGALRYDEGRLDESERDFEKARTLRPSHYQAMGNLALLRKKQGRLSDALEGLDNAIAHHPPALIRTDLETERALLLSLAGRPRDALDACQTILKSHPKTPEVLGIRAQAFLALNRDADALRSFDDYLDAAGPPTSDVFRGRGQARMKLSDFAGAADDYTRALMMKPGWDIQTHRGWAYFFAEASGLALRDFDTALRLNPANVDAYIGRGLARVALGQTGPAVADAEEAFGRAPGSPEMWHNIACIFAQAAGQRRSSGGAPNPEELSARDCRRAIAAIGEALSRVPVNERPAFWREKMLPDHYLDPIRRSAEFLELERKLGDEPAPAGPTSTGAAPG